MIDYNTLQLIVGMAAIVFIVAVAIWVGIYYYNEYKLSRIAYVEDEPWQLCPWWRKERSYKVTPPCEEEWCSAPGMSSGKFDCEQEECLLIKMYRMIDY